MHRLPASLLLLAVSTAASAVCPDTRATRNVYFGDLHVHTSYSFDAVAFGVSVDPAGSYAAGAATLDFSAVTDHAKYLASTELCTTPGSAGYDTSTCQDLRNGVIDAPGLVSLCRDSAPIIDPELCAEALGNVWTRIQHAANEANVPCEFTTFIAYEYTLVNRRHRNVVFATDVVPATVADALDYPTPRELLEQLDTSCVTVPGCQVLAIPHTSNASGGLMFAVEDSDGLPLTAEEAALRGRLEPLVEVFQHKGSSECYPGIGNVDELCAFEQVADARIIPPGQTEVPRLSFVREGLKEGLRLAQTLGVNPYRFGLSAASDTHNGLPGATAESTFNGHAARLDDEATERLGVGDKYLYNPGGLTGVWAVENTRPEIFRALARREAFGTSGPRLRVRFFGGWDYDPALCAQPNLIAPAYNGGVPMGSDLRAATSAAPRLLVVAQRDPASAGIKTLQIVKGWLEQGELAENVVTVMESASPAGVGVLCTVWTDPAFDPASPAFYYARVLEAPSDRWSTYDCAANGVDCGDPDSVEPLFARCCDDSIPQQIQERAWSSPIWYSP